MTALSVRDLKKIYPNGVAALKGIELDVAEGDFFALLGQNGAGKSTTIGIVSSLIKKTSGRVRIFGYDLDLETAKAKAMLGVMPQEINFSIFEKITNILIAQAGYYGVKRSVACERLELYLTKLGLWELRNQAAIQLSGGMKRRLMVVRALIHHPKLLILDEPTAGVDVELRHLLWQFLTDLNQEGMTIILTTHYLEEAEHLCKNVAIIDQGEIIEHAKMKTLVNRIKIQTLIFDLEKALPVVPSFAGYQLRLIDEVTLEAKIVEGQSINNLLQHLLAQNIKLLGLRNKSNRLEELFIHLIHENKNRV